jgi:hypothetical protein
MFMESHCQRFFVQGRQSSFFVVHVASEVQELKTKSSVAKPDLLLAILSEQLHGGRLEQQTVAQIYSSTIAKTDVSPWLDMTRWPRYFDGLDMAQVAPLAYGPNPVTEPGLVLMGDSFDRIIEQAHRSICEDKISVFDQAKINSFIVDRSAKQDRMIMVKLQRGRFELTKIYGNGFYALSIGPVCLAREKRSSIDS